MYLSRVELDLTRRSTMEALAAPQKLHGAVESAFPGERRRRLWRLDYLGERLYLLLLSEDQPDLPGLAEQFGPITDALAETRDYDPLLRRVTAGSLWQFRLTANPTKSCPTPKGDGARGTVHAHITVAHQKEWLLQRGERHGFALTPDSFTVMGSRWLRFAKGGDRHHPVTLLSVTYEGVLEVTDPQTFCRMLTSGLGRGKAYGLGLMTILQRGRSRG